MGNGSQRRSAAPEADGTRDISIEPEARAAEPKAAPPGPTRSSRRVVAFAAIAVAAIALLIAVVGSMLTDTERVEPDIAEPDEGPSSPATSEPPTASPAALPLATPAAGLSIPSQLVDPPVEIIAALQPHLMAADGRGGFVGVRTPVISQPRRARFTRSTDGEHWSFASNWLLPAYEYVSRLERVGPLFFAWTDSAVIDIPGNRIQLAVSDNLADWRRHDIEISNFEPDGLIYTTEVTGVAVNDDDILLLVESTIELDERSLGLEDGLECGWMWNMRGVYDLCGGETLLELTLDEMADTPPPIQLFLSRDGQPFERVGWPFHTRRTYRLIDLPGAFVALDVDRSQLLVSSDGVFWSRGGTTPRGTFVALGGAPSGQLLGVVAGTNRGWLFEATGPEATFIPLSRVIPWSTGDFDAVLDHGPGGWVAALTPTADPDAEPPPTWVIHSTDGLEWNVLASPILAEGRQRVHVGDREVVVRVDTPIGAEDHTFALDP